MHHKDALLLTAWIYYLWYQIALPKENATLSKAHLTAVSHSMTATANNPDSNNNHRT